MKIISVLSVALMFVVLVLCADYAIAQTTPWLPAPYNVIPICVAGLNTFPCIGNSPFWLAPAAASLGLLPTSAAYTSMIGITGTQIANLAAHVARCNLPDPTVYGLTVGTVYCVKGYIALAAGMYTENLRESRIVTTYQAACYLLAAAIFGTRMMTMHTQEIGKEVFLFLSKLAIALFLVANSVNIYVWLSGGMGQLIGMTTSAVTLGAEPNSCAILYPLRGMLTLADSSVNYAEYEAWHYVDCLLMRLTGATISTPLSTASIPFIPASVAPLLPDFVPSLIGASVLMILITALTTSTVGFGLAAIGLWVIWTILKLIMRCLYLTLLAYLLLAMVVIFLPLFAPLLVFNSHRPDSYTREIFNRWVNQIAAAFIQPALYMGYLSFAIVIMHAFLEGDTSDNPSVRAIFSNCQHAQQSTHLCSFGDLFSTQNEKLARVVGSDDDARYLAATGDFSWITSTRTPLINWRIMGDPQAASLDCNAFDRSRTFIPKTVVDSANQIAGKALSLIVPGPERLSEDYVVMLQAIITLLCMVLVIAALSALLEMLPALSKTIVRAGSISLFEGMKGPLEGLMNQAFTGAKKGAGDGTAGLMMGGGVRGAMQGVKNIPGQTVGAVEGTVNQLTKMLRGGK